ncbi:MAG: L-histidine N(alpha)-methyltransferase [Hyphomicrobiales bacterium]|nr:MAG: L-histidine N(alpha)-methyltransferase [Hyphomicrobiales bacterium]
MPNATEGAALPAAQVDDFSISVVDGLSRRRKSLPYQFFYDAVGSVLFEEITRQPEYYLTRTEVAILEASVVPMLEQSFDETVLVEFGPGSSVKTEIVLRQMHWLYAYTPVDVSESFLADSRQRLQNRLPDANIRPLLADFSHRIDLPPELAERNKLGLFLGSTIGNFAPSEATQLLRAMRATLSPEGRLIVGVDLKKDVRQLLGAYNDAMGVTAAFNLKPLSRINRELGGDFDLQAFRHEAIYNPIEGRIEMHLVSLKDQIVGVADREFRFRKEETIHTENAYKYTIEEFHRIAGSAGWSAVRVWMDDQRLFSVHELVGPR